MSLIRDIFSGIIQLFRWWFIVAPWEQAVRVRLGKWVRVLGPGMHLKIPWIDQIYLQAIRRRFSPLPMQTLTTADAETVTLRGSLGYVITDLLRLYQTLHDAEDTVELEATGIISDYVTTHTLADCTPAALSEHVREKLNLSRYGLGDVEFYLMDFAIVRTFRLIQDVNRGWKHGGCLTTEGPNK